ncbi:MULTISPECIES: TPM domain-containing protein [unclassified Agromyces]|uniref:TPM domain-containing protein n=1 Tax=unclassified Agromyces TaxID=2639701 RepID=UPI0030145788
MRSVRWSSIAVAALAGLLVVAPAAPALAEDPVSFGGSPVVDTAGALTPGEEAEVEAAIDRTADDTGRQLFVAYVDEFTNPEDAASWAVDTANANNMGTEDYLLAVAVEGRSYYFSAAPDASLSQDDTDRISIERVEPELRDEDWAGAAIAAAEALGDGGGGGGFGGGFIWILLAGVAVIAVIAVVLARRRGRRGDAPGVPGGGPGAEPAEPAVPLDELRRRAASALVQADDSLKTSEEELGFATAGFGEEATAGFRTALEGAKGRVAEAFGLQQRLDDHEPDSEAQQREWYGTILSLTAEAESILDAEAERFDALRDLEQNAPQALARVEAAARAAEDGIAPAAQRLQALGAQYAASALATVADNPEQARARVAFARDSIDEARAALARGETGAAAVDIRAAEEATDQARLLAAAIERIATDLAETDRAVAAGVDDLDADVRTARGMQDAGLASLADRVEAEASAIRAELGRAGRSPLDLTARIDRVNAEIDRAVQGVRDAQAQAQRTRAELDRSLLAARTQVQAAEDYLVARRGAIGSEARTRLAEAGRLVVEAQALAASDPAGALATAQRAEQLAGHAMSLAQQDVSGFGGGMPGGMFGGQPTRGAGGGDLFGAVLGGILIDSMMGGGGGGGMFGGGGRSSGGFDGGFGGGRSPGSFGGSATRARRGSGGRF